MWGDQAGILLKYSWVRHKIPVRSNHNSCDIFTSSSIFFLYGLQTNCEIFQEKLAQDPATQELRGALQAHAMVANPSFIFQKPAGNKVRQFCYHCDMVASLQGGSVSHLIWAGVYHNGNDP